MAGLKAGKSYRTLRANLLPNQANIQVVLSEQESISFLSLPKIQILFFRNNTNLFHLSATHESRETFYYAMFVS